MIPATCVIETPRYYHCPLCLEQSIGQYKRHLQVLNKSILMIRENLCVETSYVLLISGFFTFLYYTRRRRRLDMW
ncbi:protein E22A [Elephant endotheliotropic herpesvirus 1A]|uniref:Protein E22A n=1 Tax=Elephant endotheliotropic herpesvirus 1A TaxID=759753 RepID=A0A0S1NI02_ELHV1|nr:protein E22A [Elephant endotheliotropic herpesvirus 1A]APG41548.1 protein E22A [Elephant endotheliotropic herpesvirus 1A]APG41569.1 protein E22A [Elephant endotheliotropic herpesvirus 1A]AYC62715.1 protein E22A [Elephant endotheliotropic herpesvirus 1A]AYC62729.1 protein E22A [Elephant endotheliotropic herpesvirus 1A]